MYDAIFPRLPYKSAMRLKTVWKNVREKIDNPTFSAKQSRMCLLCPALIHIGRFAANSNEYAMELLSSTPTNIKLALSLHQLLFTFNAESPIDTWWYSTSRWDNGGGACMTHVIKLQTIQKKFQIIHANPIQASGSDLMLQFMQILKNYCPKRWSIHVVSFDYDEDLLWFDVTTNKGGTIKMPKEDTRVHVKRGGNATVLMHQTVACSCDPSWELKHTKGWKDIVEMNGNAFQFCHSMKLRNAWQSKFHEKVLRYDMLTGKVEDMGKELDNACEMKPTPLDIAIARLLFHQLMSHLKRMEFVMAAHCSL
ncbi:hypothetical protein EJB05_01610, partial [Eragrostis curvula]